mgnify:CR=1 FL=1
MKRTMILDRLRDWARAIKRDVVALYLAARDPRVPRLAKVVAACVVAYALSPIDLIPDFIPVLGYLDDAIFVPLGILLAVRLVPGDVMADLRSKADLHMTLSKSRAAVITVVVIWLAAAIAIGWWASTAMKLI